MTASSAGLTPAQTVGPYLAIGLPWDQGPFAVPEGTAGAIRISGRVLDGAGEPIVDALVETWQPEPARFARCPTGDDGAWFVLTSAPEGAAGQAPHLGSTCSPAGCCTGSTPAYTSPNIPRRTPLIRCSRSCQPTAVKRWWRRGATTAIDSTSASRVPARRSSSTSELFGGLYARGAATVEVSDGAWLQAMLDVEAALARACAREGLMPESAADAIAAACRAERFDLAALGRATGEHATPVVGLVRALRAAVPGDVAEHVHLGATSQDIVDTAAMLITRRALVPIVADGAAAAAAAAGLARAHRDTMIAGRTLLQQAVPTSFGLKAAGWLNGIEEALAGVIAVRDTALAVQMGGPVGHRSPAVGARVATELGLVEPVLPWHANRVRPVALAAALGVLSGVLGKVAGDVALLAQNEVAEAREGGGAGRGGSSAMAYKRNPVAAVSVLACAERAPGLAATMLGAMGHEHERAAGAWQAEWGTLSELLRLTGSAAAWASDLLGNLVVDPVRMAANARGLEGGLGAAGELIDRALSAHERAPR